jgi:hypothetical protein
MRQTPQGVQQLGQALRDQAAGKTIRVVNEFGQVVLDEDGNGRVVNDTYLRGEFPPPGKSKSHRPGDTPADQLHNATAALAAAMDAAAGAFELLTKVLGDDGRPLVDVKGIDARDCKAWRDQIGRMDEEFVVWSRTFRRVHRVDQARPEPSESDGENGVAEEFDEESEELKAAE